MAKISTQQVTIVHLMDKEGFWKLLKSVREEGSLESRNDCPGFLQVSPSGWVALLTREPWTDSQHKPNVKTWDVWCLCQLYLLSGGLRMIAIKTELWFWSLDEEDTLKWESFWSLWVWPHPLCSFLRVLLLRMGFKKSLIFCGPQSCVPSEMWLELGECLVYYVQRKGSLALQYPEPLCKRHTLDLVSGVRFLHHWQTLR